VHRNFAEENLGLRRRLSSGFDWVFDHVDRAIIIEDDILAEPTFFTFAQEMLERYLNDPRVMCITGYNPVGWYYPEASRERLKASYPYSYYFSAYGSIWGWATWRRAWKSYYDVEMKLWTPALEAELVKHPRLSKSRVEAYSSIHQGANTWDYQWSVACLLQSALFVVPAQNLIQNIGYGAFATHTTDTLTRHATITSEPMAFPLIHPPWMMPWPTYERAAHKVYNGVPWRNWLLRRLPRPLFDRGRVLFRRLEKLWR
jgi:hypothetical protein